MAEGAAFSLLEQLNKAFLDLQALRDASPGDKVQWKEIEEHFRGLDTSFKEKFAEVEAKEKEFELKEAETRSSIAERTAVVAVKAQDMRDRVQELKDVAVAAVSAFVSISTGQHRLNPEPVNGGEDGEKGNKVSSSLIGKNGMSHSENFPVGTAENPKGVANIAQPRLRLMHFCQQMDSAGLLHFILENRGTLDDIRMEFPIALASATEPARLVLELLVGIHLPDGTGHPEIGQAAGALVGIYKSCIVILEALAVFMARADADHILNPETKKEAKEIACEWILRFKSTVEATDGSYSLRAEALLQLLATFRVGCEFDGDELGKLVFAAAHSRQTPELCLSLGLTEKMPEIIQQLINSGKEVDAVHFIHAFQLTDRFPPVPLLKTFLKDLRRNSQGKGFASGNASTPQIDVNARELAGLRAVIGCVKEFHLESEYTLDPLMKRLEQLEKARPDKKRNAVGGGGDPHRGHNQPFKKSKSKSGGAPNKFRGPQIGGPGYMKPPTAPPQRVPYLGQLPNTAPHDYPIPTQLQYAHQGYDRRSYYYPQETQLAPTSYDPADYHPQETQLAPASYNPADYRPQAIQLASTSYEPAGVPNYGSYNPSGLQSSYPYM